MEIPIESLQRLSDAGLIVSTTTFPATHQAFPYGRSIHKPQTVLGNNVPEYECYLIDDDDNRILLDAPSAQLFHQDAKYVVCVHEMVPGPGPGDFRNEHDNLDEAINDILEYYFGNPARMKLIS